MHRMRASRSSSPGSVSAELLVFPVGFCPLERLPFVGRLLRAATRPLLPVLPPFGSALWAAGLVFPSPFLPEGRIPLRQFSGRAQPNNAGVLKGWRFWSRSTQAVWISEEY